MAFEALSAMDLNELIQKEHLLLLNLKKDEQEDVDVN
jgi:hypothetical protein